ncbi:hypothetical protein C8Q74DRAFT_1217083 [Fomes fomentarius]|nr:hypothetical protein C8Q74DRAFT_1217083 [Fomes fomentarius]
MHIAQFKKHSMPTNRKKEKKDQARVLRTRCATCQQMTLKVCKKVLEDHGLEHHLMLLDKLEPCHMSGDKPKVDSTEDSMSREFIAFLWLLDAWHVADHIQAVGDGLCGGNTPQKRIPSDEPKHIKGAALKGLWQNCYDPEWLVSLKPCMQESLEIIPKDYPFWNILGWDKVAPMTGAETAEIGKETPNTSKETPRMDEETLTDVKGKEHRLLTLSCLRSLAKDCQLTTGSQQVQQALKGKGKELSTQHKLQGQVKVNCGMFILACFFSSTVDHDLRDSGWQWAQHEANIVMS